MSDTPQQDEPGTTVNAGEGNDVDVNQGTPEPAPATDPGAEPDAGAGDNASQEAPTEETGE